MTHILSYVEDVRAGVKGYGRIPEHQALAYSTEHIVQRALPLPLLNLEEARAFIDKVCGIEDIDVPRVERPQYLNKRFEACASHDDYFIALRGSHSPMTLCHELAHCLTADGHGFDWRSKFVHLTRTHVSVEHGALLRTLYVRLDLPTDWLVSHKPLN